MEWITSAGKFEGVIGPRMLATLEQFVLLQAPHAKVGTLGFCWGALMATLFATSHSQMVSAVSGCHPSRVTVDLVGSLHCPMLYAHAYDDPDVEPYEAIVKEKLPADVAAKCVFKKYASPAVHHGYVLRGPYEQGSEKTKAAEETVRMVAEFFSSNLA
jgi:dienelactone hydrolase